MALQDILKKIRLDGDAVVDQIMQDLEAEKKQMKAQSKEIEAKELEALEAKTASALSSIESKTKSMARRENARAILEAKQEVIKGLLSKFQAKLEALPEKEYLEVVSKLIAKITDKEGVVLAPKARVAVTQKAVPSGMTVEANDEVSGGFIFRSKSGGEVDNTFASLVNSEFRSDLEMHFAQQLKFI